MKKNVLIFSAAAMLLSSCIVKFNNKIGGIPPAASADAAIKAANEAASKGFNGIEAHGSFDVYYTQDSTSTVRIVGDTASIRHTIVKSDGSTLTIAEADGKGLFKSKSYNVNVYITSPELAKVGMYGSGDFKTKGGVSSDRLDMEVAGSGSLVLDGVKANHLSINIAGSGNATTGHTATKTTDVSIAGSGNVGINGIKTDGLNTSIAGSGDIKITGADINRAKCAIAGSGDIDIKGNVRQCDRSIAGSGSVSIKK